MADHHFEPTTRTEAIRAELKEWERAFAAANEGRKADRKDIKKVPEIAAKYKEYSKLKSLESSKNQPSKAVELQERPKKRKHSFTDADTENIPPASTPRKAPRGQSFTTPSKTKNQPVEFDSPSVLRRLFSPSTHQQTTPLKSAIGPTPQRDGKALGLFDLLSESGGSTATPTAERLATVRGAAAVTPSKRRAMDTIVEEDERENDEEDSPRMERTPQSSGKKFMLSTLFATPTTWRYATMMENEDDRGRGQDDAEDAAAATTATAEAEDAVNEPAGSETPSFLRRSNSARYAAASRTGGGLSPIAVRKPPQFVGKGLSALVQGLRDMEEERMQEEWDVLREIEIEAEQAAANVEVADSQAPGDEGLRPFKKKGQKRTTRRVNMKPVVAKPRQEPQIPQYDDEADHATHESDDELAAVPETQHPSAPSAGEAQDWDDTASLQTLSEPDLDSDADYEESSRPLARGKSFTEKMKEAIGADKPPSQPTSETAPAPKAAAKDAAKNQPRPRKVNPEAHANYRSLKIRNKNSKGRFGRRYGRR